MTPRQPQSKNQDEAPVKGWELAGVQSQVDRHEKVINSFDTKLDQIITLLSARPTTAEVDAKIELAVKNAVEKQDLKYAPIVQNNKLLIGGLLTTGLGLLASLVMLVVTLARQS